MNDLSKKVIATTLVTLILFSGILAIPLEKFFIDATLSSIQIDQITLFLKSLLIISISVFAIKKLNIKALAGLDKQLSWSKKYLIFIPLYLLILGALQIFGQDLSEVQSINILLLFFSTMAVGFSEELVFRGILQSVYIKGYYEKKNRVFYSVLIPAIIFGLLHLLNFEIKNIAQELSQVLYAIFFGVFYGALLLKTNKLIPLAIVHGLINFVFGFSNILNNKIVENETIATDVVSDVINSIASTIVVLPLFIVGLIVIRKVKKENIKNKIYLSNTNENQ